MITVERIQASAPGVDAAKAAAVLERIQQMKAGTLLETLAKPRQRRSIVQAMPAPVVPRERKPCCQRGKPGNELTALLKSLGIDSKWCATGCKGYSAQMNQWGVEGCRARRAEIVQRLAEQQAAAGWSVTAKAAGMALVSGIAFAIDLTNPLGWLVDEAIRRAEKCETGECGT